MMTYTLAMIVSKAVADNLGRASWIRRMFEEEIGRAHV